jgi:AAA-like domain/Bacterial regulatory proteins, luxR family/TIR domain
MDRIEFANAFTNLTERQLQVLCKVLAGEKDADIAAELHVARVTVRKHIENICKTLGLGSQDSGYSHRPELIALCAKHRPDLFDSFARDSALKPQIVLSYHGLAESDFVLVSELSRILSDRGDRLLIADSALRMATNGLQHICTALNGCDRLILLLSPLSAYSEVVTEEVRLAKTLQDDRDGKPLIFAVRLNCPLSLLNHDLRGYLQGAPQQEWKTSKDTDAIAQTLLHWLDAGDRNGHVAPIPPEPQSMPSPYTATPNFPPQPVAEPELPRGQVELASAFYIERPGIDRRCYEAISKPGALIRIKAPRQMGKTSLMARILHYAQQQGYATVPLSFQLADSSIFRDLERFLKWFSANIALQLQLRDRLADYWNPIFGSKVACKSYFEQYLLAQTSSPLALGLDEVDVVFKYPELAADFFGLLRAWHEEAKNREIWRKFRLVVVHSTEVYVPMDINQSPFNVGLPVELPEFKPAMVLELLHRHGLTWGDSEIEQLMAMVGGHPYLVRLALYHIARQETTLTELLETASTDAGLYSDHLRRHLWFLGQNAELAAALKMVVDSESPVQLDSIQGFKLHSLGLVNFQGNQVTPRCNLYRQYFRARLNA